MTLDCHDMLISTLPPCDDATPRQGQRSSDVRGRINEAWNDVINVLNAFIFAGDKRLLPLATQGGEMAILSSVGGPLDSYGSLFTLQRSAERFVVTLVVIAIMTRIW